MTKKLNSDFIPSDSRTLIKKIPLTYVYSCKKKLLHVNHKKQSQRPEKMTTQGVYNNRSDNLNEERYHDDFVSSKPGNCISTNQNTKL